MMKRIFLLLSLLLAADIFSAASISAGYFERPSGYDIVQDVSRHASNTHPRILVNESTFKKINTMYFYDETLRTWCDAQISAADRCIAEECVGYGLNDKIRMLSSIQKSGDIIFKTAFAYRITDDKKYAARAWKETENFCNQWPDWNPYQMLGVGEALFNCAIAYDWLYDYLNETQKKTIRDAVQNKGWRHYYNDINGLAVSNGAKGRPNTPYQSEEEELVRSSLWRSYARQNNWNFVINGGVIDSALAICEEVPVEAAQILDFAIEDIEPALKGYAPDGAWFEGLSYWDYATEFLVNIVSSLEASCGTDYGICSAEGLDKTGRYYFAMNGADGRFNFSDCGIDVSASSDLLWIANKYNEPDVAINTYENYKENNITGGARSILWYVNCPFMGNYDLNEQYDHYFRGVETVTMRSSYERNANFIGLHGGKNTDPHAHIDSGTFVLDACGERFAMDLGPDNYNIAGGHYAYRYSAQGHNIIVFDPENSGCGQIMEDDQNAGITAFESGADSSFAVCDLTDSYSGNYVTSYKRGIRLLDNKTRFIMQDEFTTANTIPELYWFMHTEAEIKLSDDRRSAVLTQNGKSLTFKIISDIDGEFSIMPPVGIRGTKTAEYDGQEGQYSNAGIQKLAIHMTNVEGDVVISIGAYYEGTDKFEPEPIDCWTVGEEESPMLSEIKINGTLLESFKSDVTEYTYKTAAFPQITARGNGEITVLTAGRLNSNVYIFTANGRGTKVYKIKLYSEGNAPVNPYNSFADNGYKKTFDGNLNTCVSLDACELLYDIGYVAKVNGIAVSALADGDITLSVSEDGYNFYEVYSGACTAVYENIVNEVLGFRYLRLRCDSKIELHEISVDIEADDTICDLIIGLYDADGSLTNVQIEKIQLISNFKYSYKCVADDSDITAKVFLWNMNRLYPLSKADGISRE